MTEIANHLIDAVARDNFVIRFLAYGCTFLALLAIAAKAITGLLKTFSNTHTEARTAITWVATIVRPRARLTAAFLWVIFALLLFIECSSGAPLTRTSVLIIAWMAGALI